MLAYVRGFVVLFVLLALLLYLPPGGSYQKYIRFFAELILVFGVLSPVLSIVCDSEMFLELIAYEEFVGGLSEMTRDMERMEYLHADYYRQEYENAIALDVEEIVRSHGFVSQETKVDMSGNYEVERIQLWVTGEKEQRIVIREVGLREEEGGEPDAVYAGLRQDLSAYYRLDASQIEIHGAGAG